MEGESKEMEEETPALKEDPEPKEESENMVFGRQEYAKKEFWDERFSQSSDSFDWYVTWKELKPIIMERFPIEVNKDILMVGCGNSTLSGDMAESGYPLIHNIDISDVVITQMREKYSKYSGLIFQTMDATKMDFETDSFPLVIDKGTFDALACAFKDEITSALICEMYRVSSKYVAIITHGKPAHRVKGFTAYLNLYYENTFNITHMKLELSNLAELINILRVKCEGKPLSYAMKNKEIFRDALREMQSLKVERKLRENGDPKSKMAAMIVALARKKRLEANKKTEIEQNINEHIEKDQPEAKNDGVDISEEKKEDYVKAKDDKVGKIAQKEIINKENENKEGEKLALNENKKGKGTYNPQRQENCYLYIIEKLSS